MYEFIEFKLSSCTQLYLIFSYSSYGSNELIISSLFGAMFPLPRIIYAMASDGLVFKFLGTVNDRFSSPVIGTLMAGLLTGKY